MQTIIAKELCPENMQSVRIQAGKEVHARIDKLLADGKSFALESTLSGVGHVKTIEKAQKERYEVAVLYTFVDSPATCIERIKARVQNGGHPVPDEDVIRRFERSRTNFWNIYKDKADMWLLVYNGEDMVFPVAIASKDTKVAILSEKHYTMFKRDL